MAVRRRSWKEQWHRLRTSSHFHGVVMFLIFVCVATLFWFILKLNDSVTQTFRVRLNFENVPDSVVFISNRPSDIHVTVRDKGTNILRSGVIRNPVIDVNFRDYSNSGVLRLSKSDLTAELKSSFGSSVQIVSTSIDSLRLLYTEEPGKRVPVEVKIHAEASSGNVIAGTPVPLTSGVLIYSFGNEKDTVNRVRTKPLNIRGLSQTTEVTAHIQPINGIKIVPDTVKVRINVEPLVHKEGFVKVETRGVPSGEQLLLFPNTVPVSYYIPMSKFSDGDIPLTVTVDYKDTHIYKGNRLPLTITSYPPFIVNPEVKSDSVEYTLVRRNR